MRRASVGRGIERAVRAMPTFNSNKAELKIGNSVAETDVETLVHHCAGNSRIPRVSAGNAASKSEVEAVANQAYCGRE
eukprot:7125312-Pyramimonas_sp.AAC.1